MPAAQAAHTQARLVLAAQNARPGDTVLAGIVLQMDPDWHIYWKNPGDSGIATKVEWELPPGVAAGPVQWPAPQKLVDSVLTTYIYKNQAVLLALLTLSSNLPAGPITIRATVSWLECKSLCIPGKEEVQGVLNIGEQTTPSAAAALLEQWQNQMPKSGDILGLRAWWEAPAKGDERTLLIEWNSTEPASDADFFPDSSDSFGVQPATQRVPAPPGEISLSKVVKKSSGPWPDVITGVLVQTTAKSKLAYDVQARLGPPNALAAGSSGTPEFSAVPLPPLWEKLIYAFIGGLILNVMPCVLPVIALKILGFVGQAKANPGYARKLGFIYALGVLVSFLILSVLVIALQAAGHKAGWGIQFANPYFLVFMTTLVTLIALNLFGVFEVHLGGGTLDAASRLSGKHGPAGAFFNGLLATVLATSCTAPFLGAAVGFAFARGQEAALTVLVFLTIGLGLAFPYVLLSCQPAWLRGLPKPGPWMERFKIAMGFPMLAAAVWLYSLASVHYGERSWWLAIFLVMVALAAWVYGEFVQRHRARPVIAIAAVLVLLVTAYFFALENHLGLLAPIDLARAQPGIEANARGVAWQTWSPAALARARAEGRPVLVDFTAQWCLTCNTIIKPALESAAVRQKIRQLNAVALLGDYTGVPDDITDELKRYGRAGVPLVLVYPKDPNAPPSVLPEALTPGMVVAALDRAGQ
ncbi:MAG TPA: protein-disulfide reductase DsbD domain-containing protein [Verrucomicrobiae bacterium]|nr:protein-disulfide reductase DsbD domain-containing protein [Verrucomicrobiae bacterium]